MQSSLVITLKLKVPNGEDEKMIMEDGYLRYLCWSDNIDFCLNMPLFDKLVVIL